MLINLTPHKVSILYDGEFIYDQRTRSYHAAGAAYSVRDIPASGTVARCATAEREVPAVDGVPTVVMAFGQVENLPAPVADTYYIVSAIVLQACPERHDLLTPAHMVRSNDGTIVGCLAFSRNV